MKNIRYSLSNDFIRFVIIVLGPFFFPILIEERFCIWTTYPPQRYTGTLNSCRYNLGRMTYRLVLRESLTLLRYVRRKKGAATPRDHRWLSGNRIFSVTSTVVSSESWCPRLAVEPSHGREEYLRASVYVLCSSDAGHSLQKGGKSCPSQQFFLQDTNE